MGPMGKDYDSASIGALIIRIAFCGIFYYTYNKEPQKSVGNY